MTSGPEQRKLAAIMFTDMVGYSALAQKNETLALELLEEHRRALRSLFPRFNGTEIKTIGDAFLVEFGSALEAAQCAIEIQRTLAHRNTDVPAEKQIQVRIGIHIGDVVHREGDVYGDGVNIASRIEPLAGPSGICISMDVERQIRHALEASLVKLPPAELKNIQVPMDLFRIVLPWEKVGAHAFAGTARKVQRAFPKPLLTGLVLLLVSGGLVWWLLSSGRLRLERSVRPPSASAEATKSLAVLPFTNLSADQADDYLSDGVTEELINLLVHVPGLRVPARTSSFVFKDKKEDIRKIGELLNVRAVLEGSVRKSGNRLRVTAQLINVADGFHLWSETYDRNVGDLLNMQEEIARVIADRLRLELSPETRQQLARRVTSDAEAHELYLKGLYCWNKRTKAGFDQAILFFNQVIERDPACAAAYAGLAACYVLLPEYALRPAREWLPKAQAAASKALDLEPGLAEAHAVLGLAKSQLLDWKGAEVEFREAISLNPNYATAHHWYCTTLRSQGRFDEALTQIRRAQDMDPLSLIILANVGWCLQWSGQYDRSIEEAKRGLDLDPNFVPLHKQLAFSYLGKGLLPEARAEFEKVRALSGETPFALGSLGFVLGRAGNQAEAVQILGQLNEYEKRGYAVRVEKALVYCGLGDRNKTLESLEEAWRQGDGGLDDLGADPFWKDLRTEPRFQELVRKIRSTP
jgi:adenylate cyclase